MAEALFIKRHDLSVFTAANGNIDSDKLLPSIRNSQKKYIQRYLGSELYNKIASEIVADTLAGDRLTLVRDYVKDMLLNWAMVEYLPTAGINISNGGVFTKNPENSTPVSEERIDKLTNYYQGTAEFFTERMIEYIRFNISKYPEYYQNSNEDIHADDVAYTTGLVL